ncbi:nucleotide-sugar transporter-domain-containing protein [Aspergillus aurantiobrunneus]
MPHKTFHIPLRTSSINPRAGGDSSNRKDRTSRSIPKAQRILGTDIALDNNYHTRSDKRTTRSAGYINASGNTQSRDAGEDELRLRVRASSPLLGQSHGETADSIPPLVQLTRKLHLSPSSSGLSSRYSHREPAVDPSKNVAEDHSQQNADGGLNPAFKQPKGSMKDTKRKTRPPKIDLSLLFPKPQTNAAPLLSPQRMVSSPSALSATSDYPTSKITRPESRLPGKKLTKTQSRTRESSRPEDGEQALNGFLHSSISRLTPPVESNPSLEKTVRTSEMDLALQKQFDAQPTPRSTERALYSQMNFSLRGRDQVQRSDSRSFASARSGGSPHSSQRTLREAPSYKSLKDVSEYPMMSKKSSRSTLKNSDLNNSSVLCLSSSEDEDDDAQFLRPHLKPGKTKRDSVSTYGGYDAEICTASAAQATRGTLRSVERPSSSTTQNSWSSSKNIQPWRDSTISMAKTSSSTAGYNQSRRSSGVPAVLEPGFLHGDPIFDQTRMPKRGPSMSQKEINRRSRLIAVTRHEERLLEVMRQRQGKVTPSILNENIESDRRSVVSALSGPSRDSYYCSDTSFLRLSPGVPPPGPPPAIPAADPKDKCVSTPQGTASVYEEKTMTSAPSPGASLSSKSLPSPATSATSPITPTLPIHRFSPLPTLKPPPSRAPPALEPQRSHSRRRTDSSGAIAVEDAAEDRSESGELPVWALGWNTESTNLTATQPFSLSTPEYSLLRSDTAIIMGESVQRRSSGPGAAWKHASWILLTVQYTTFVLLVHYSRMMPPTGGKRYLTSTAVFFNEVVKLGISLTLALYEVSKSAPPSVPATSLLSTLAAAVFSGDSWKLAIPAALYTLANSLQYIALSNLQAATFQTSYQLKIVVSSIFGLILLKRSIPVRKWGLVLLLLVGVALVNVPVSGSDGLILENAAAHLDFPRSLEEWKSVKMQGQGLHKRSATYEGIEEDILTATPTMDRAVGVLATLGSCVASGLSGVYFEKVMRDSANSTSLWVRNVQIAVYSIFPALFIGVVFLDGEKIANGGIFDGYNWVVWTTILVQAVGGVAAPFFASPAFADARNVASATTIILTSLGSVWLFEFEPTMTYLIGTFSVLVATYLCELPNSDAKRQGFRPPPIRPMRFEKESTSDEPSPASSPKEISIKLPTTPFLSNAGHSTSRPASPGHSRTISVRSGRGSYF